MTPYLKDPQKKDQQRVMIWNFPNKWTTGKLTRDNSWLTSIRQGDWKLIYFEKLGELELYNLRVDIKEAHDLAAKFPDETKRLAKLLTQKLKGYNAQMPVDKLTKKPVPMPDEIVAGN
jgi:hypothetical protein